MGTTGSVKASRYNIVTDSEHGSRLLFNSVTAAMVEIDRETWPAVTRTLASPGSAASSEDQEIRDGLLEGGFLIPAEREEIADLRADYARRRTENPDFFLTIAPTLACNFDCDYCFQSHQTGRMTPDTEEALIAFSEKHIQSSKSIMVTWFGGEPTLCVPTIERVQGALSRLAAKYGAVLLPSSIVSNGYGLDGKTASRLLSAGVAAAQVTLDGPEVQHDRRRPLRGGQGTFRQILRNLTESAGILQIAIRINVDRDNMEGAPEVLGELERAGLLPGVQVYFAPVKASAGACADMTGRCFNTEEFAELQLRLYRDLVSRGLRDIDYPEPSPGGFCGADTENGYVVAPNGLLFKCWEELSLDGAKSVGSVLTTELEATQERNLQRYRSWNPLAKGRCVACEILPLCMGGCPLEGMSLGTGDAGSCSPWKHNLKEMLRLKVVCEQGEEVIS